MAAIDTREHGQRSPVPCHLAAKCLWIQHLRAEKYLPLTVAKRFAIILSLTEGRRAARCESVPNLKGP